MLDKTMCCSKKKKKKKKRRGFLNQERRLHLKIKLNSNANKPKGNKLKAPFLPHMGLSLMLTSRVKSQIEI